MPGGLQQFIDQLGEFVEQFSNRQVYCVETRNPNYLSKKYFDFLNEQRLHHVFLHGYYMPPIFELYQKHREQIRDITVIRLHGTDRKGIDEKVGKDWSQIVLPKDNDINALAAMLSDLNSRDVKIFIYVNNHFEGSAPRTIARIEETLLSANQECKW